MEINKNLLTILRWLYKIYNLSKDNEHLYQKFNQKMGEILTNTIKNTFKDTKLNQTLKGKIANLKGGVTKKKKNTVNRKMDRSKGKEGKSLEKSNRT